MNPSTFLQSFLKAKCPHCRQGEIYTHSPLNLTKFGAMHKHCAHCGYRYEIEPGFFFGAMYVSYAFQIAILIGSGILVSLFFKEPPIWVYVVTVAFFIVLTFPFSFRFSRLIWLYLFVNYEPNAPKIEKRKG